MSVKVMGNVWELDLAPSHKLVLLAMADHADHDGRNVHPSVRLIAHKTGYSERQVQRIIRDLEAANILIADAPNSGGRGHTTHYRIVTANGVILTPFRKGDIPEERVTSATGKGDICDVKGDTHVTRTVVTVKEPEDTRPHVSDDARALGHAWYQALNLSKRPASPERFYADMQQLANAGITPDELKGEIAWLQGWAKNGISLRLVLSKIDEYRTIAPPADNVLTIGGMTYQLGVQP